MDLIFWNKQTAQNAFPVSRYAPSDLTEAGYSYEYLSPEDFALDEAEVRHGVLAPRRQEAKLLVIQHNDTLTTEGVGYLAKYAAAGLPITLYGDLPTKWASSDKRAISVAEAALQGTLKLRNVHQFSREALASQVASIGVIPRAQVTSNGIWWTRWRETVDGDTYVYIYNDGPPSTGNITFAATGPAYLQNPWSGEEERVVSFVATKDTTTIPFTLNNRQISIVRFSRGKTPKEHITSSSEDVIGFSASTDGTRIAAKVRASSSSSIQLSSRKTITVSTKEVQKAYSLTSWDLTLEHWLPQDDLYDLEPDAKKVNSTIAIDASSLKSWSDLGYPDVSGIGYYTTTFQWNPKRPGGVQLVVPPIPHGIVGTLNGKALPTFDITNPIVEMTSQLKIGTNSLVLKVSSTLMNSLSSYWDRLETVGKSPSHDYDYYTDKGLGRQLNGIIGDVRVVPYQLIQVLK